MSPAAMEARRRRRGRCAVKGARGTESLYAFANTRSKIALGLSGDSRSGAGCVACALRLEPCEGLP